MSLHEFFRAIPKAELHVHLEGAIRPATLLKLAKKRRLDLPATTEEGLTEWFRFRDFDHFIEIYVFLSRCLRNPEDFQVMLEDFIEERRRQNIVYTEAHFTISTHAAHGANPGEVADAMAETIEAGERDHGVQVRLIPDIVRNVEWSRADLTLEWALANRDRTVAALGISGKESSPSEPFREHFAAAEKEGLHRVAHAGEQAGPESIRSVIECCRPQRIGHGIRAVDDKALMAELAGSGMPLEVCPTSNLCLGLADDYETHPFGKLHEAGLAVTLNSDDPALFDVELATEYTRAAQAFQLDAAEICRLARRAVRQSFLADDEKERMAESFKVRQEELAQEILGHSLGGHA